MTTISFGTSTPQDLSQDLETVVGFMANNGGFVLAYQRAEQRMLKAGYVLSQSRNGAERTEAVRQIEQAKIDMKRCKNNMVDIHRNPEDWTLEDLQKMKADPKGAAAFNALLRIREAMYSDAYAPEIKQYILRKIQTAMPDRVEIEPKEVLALMRRAQKVAGGKLGAVLELDGEIRTDPLEDRKFDQQEALALLERSGVVKDADDRLKKPLDTAVTDAVKGIKGSISLAA